ncbi:hypothetical protein [Solitalea koreensis]|uniref:Uncharacterized protein n=1 Tax=Solitalea koreensis TaxID=543615 RepID=A0A521C269_9SPHI|nr:hypothetical protein [Solitalea koreensis]SMO53493.1 hypothetical protein SAMN06265350_103138 [Solitalea koreensis]
MTNKKRTTIAAAFPGLIAIVIYQLLKNPEQIGWSMVMQMVVALLGGVLVFKGVLYLFSFWEK